MYDYIFKQYEEEHIHITDEVGKRKLLNTLKEIAIENLFKKQIIKDIPWKKVLKLIEQGLKSYEELFNTYCANDQRLGMQLYYCIPQLKKKDYHSIEEYNFNILYSRKKGWNKETLQNCADEELKTLAHFLYSELENDEPLSIFPPPPEVLIMLIEQAIDTFNQDIQKARTFGQKLIVIDAFIYILEITHIFFDGNCRTAYLLLNELLIKVGIK